MSAASMFDPQPIHDAVEQARRQFMSGQGALGALTAAGVGLGMTPIGRGLKFRLNHSRSISALRGDKEVGRVSLADDGPYIGSISVVPKFRGQGVAKELYEQIEKLAGEQLIPSPMGLTDRAKQIWKKRLAAMKPSEAKRLVSRSFEIGRQKGVKEEWLEDWLGGLLGDVK
jgi:GNAT superfamily N-acetyltransferase